MFPVVVISFNVVTLLMGVCGVWCGWIVQVKMGEALALALAVAAVVVGNMMYTTTQLSVSMP